MKQYTDLLSRILAEGRYKPNRTGVGSYSIVGPQIEFDMDDGFPLETLRPIFFKGIVHENLWFLDGVCNNEDLLANNVKIWDKWALKEDITEKVLMSPPELIHQYANHMGYTVAQACEVITKAYLAQKPEDVAYSAEDEIKFGMTIFEKEGLSLYKDDVVMSKGFLGPIYGVLWRDWQGRNGKVDQIRRIIDKLKSDNPKLRYSRANIVTAFDPSVVPDETVGPQESIENGLQALAACHTMFQFFAEPLTQQERIDLLTAKIESGDFKVTGPTDTMDQHLDEQGIPRDQLSLKLYQRSADFPVGVPFNIAGYSLLLHMFAAQCNMKPARFIHTFGDAHIYSDQVEGVRELLTRAEGVAPNLPTLKLNPNVKSIFDYKFEDFELVGYNPIKPQIVYPVAV